MDSEMEKIFKQKHKISQILYDHFGEEVLAYCKVYQVLTGISPFTLYAASMSIIAELFESGQIILKKTDKEGGDNNE